MQAFQTAKQNEGKQARTKAMRKATPHPRDNLIDIFCGVQSFSDSSLALGSLYVRLSSLQWRQKQNNNEEQCAPVLARLSINGEAHMLRPSSMQRLLSHAKTACSDHLCALFSLLQRLVVRRAMHAWISAVTPHPQAKSRLQATEMGVEEVLSSDLRATTRKLVGYMYLWRRAAMQRALTTWERETRMQRRVIERCFDAWKLRVMKRRAAMATLDRLLWKYDDNRRTQIRTHKRRSWQQWKEVTEMLRHEAVIQRVWQAWLLFVKRQRLNRVRIQRLHTAIWRRHFLLRRNERFVSQKVESRTLQEALQTWRGSYRRRSTLRRCIARMQQQALSRAWSAWVEFACVAAVVQEAEADEDQPATGVMSPTRTQEPEHHHIDATDHQRRHMVCRCVRCFRRYGHLGAAEPSRHNDGSFAVFESQCSLDEHLERRLLAARKLVASTAAKPKSRRKPKIKPATTTKLKPKSLNASRASQQDDGTDRIQRLFQAAHAIVQARSRVL